MFTLWDEGNTLRTLGSILISDSVGLIFSSCYPLKPKTSLRKKGNAVVQIAIVHGWEIHPMHVPKRIHIMMVAVASSNAVA